MQESFLIYSLTRLLVFYFYNMNGSSIVIYISSFYILINNWNNIRYKEYTFNCGLSYMIIARSYILWWQINKIINSSFSRSVPMVIITYWNSPIQSFMFQGFYTTKKLVYLLYRSILHRLVLLNYINLFFQNTLHF